MKWQRFVLMCGLLSLCAAMRLLPHPPNVTPVGAMAIFAGAMFVDRRVAMLAPLVVLGASDLVIGEHWLMPVVYGSMLISVLIGRLIATSRFFGHVAVATFVGATQFFIITNLACWWSFYPHSLEGLADCFTLAIPFFQNSLAGDALFSTGLFGAVWLAEKSIPSVRAGAPAVIAIT